MGTAAKKVKSTKGVGAAKARKPAATRASAARGGTLVVVESPAKAKTIKK